MAVYPLKLIEQREFHSYLLAESHSKNQNRILAAKITLCVFIIMADFVRLIGYYALHYDGIPYWYPHVVVLQSKFDPEESFRSPGAQYEIIELKKTHRVTYREIDDISSFHQTIQEASQVKKIQCLIIRGHGNETVINLGLSTFRANDLNDQDQASLDPTATIILASCKTAPLAQDIETRTGLTTIGPVECISWNDCMIQFVPDHEKIEVFSNVPYNHPVEPLKFYDARKRAEFLSERVKAGDRVAACNLFEYYSNGYEKSDQKSLEMLTLAAEKGFTPAQMVLGFAYMYGRYSAPCSRDIATTWLLLAALENHKTAQYYLAEIYYEEKLYEQAVKWYTESAQQSDPDALYKLGQCYLDGKGVAKDEAKAVTLFNQAADQNNEKAKTALQEINARKAAEQAVAEQAVAEQAVAEQAVAEKAAAEKIALKVQSTNRTRIFLASACAIIGTGLLYLSTSMATTSS